MKFLQNLIEKVGQFLSHLITGAENSWEGVQPEVQDAMIKASTIVAIINKYLDQTPEFILQAIQNKFPDIPLAKIKEVLHVAAIEINGVRDATVSNDALSTIQSIQLYLSRKKGAGWATASDALSKVIAIFLAPKGTKATPIISLMWYAYQKFVKH